MITDIRIETAGRWANVLQSIGYDAKLFNGKHQPCPYCQGKDRARWDRSKEFLICGQCGDHQPVDMAMQYLNLSFKETANYIRPNIGKFKMTQAAQTSTEQNKARLMKIHSILKRITPDSPAEKYFKKRGLSVLPMKDVFFHPFIPYYKDGKKIAEYPAIVSIFRNISGETATYHITYIDIDGNKANVETPRKILPCILDIKGTSIQLFDADSVMCVAEGIETALAVYQDTGCNTWAAGNANNLINMKFPDIVKTVFIYVDNDKTFTGQQAGYTLAKRLVNEGKSVRVMNIIKNTLTEDYGEKIDYNDFIQIKNAA